MLDVKRLPRATIYWIGVKKVGLGEFFGLPYNNRLIPNPEPWQFLLSQDARINERLEFFVNISGSKFMS
jgi:hypothetical protein